MSLFHWFSCFLHIVNLACKAVLAAMTAVDFAGNAAKGCVPPDRASNQEPGRSGILGAIQHDPIATLRSLIKGVSNIYIITFCHEG